MNATRNPVLLLHGIKDDSRKMEPLARHLRKSGWPEAHAFSYAPSWGQIGLDELAQQVATQVECLVPAGAKFDLVAFSMGGLVSRYYLQRLGGAERVERFITISTPHRGTLMAHLLANTGGRQMRSGSHFLLDLERDAEQLAKLKCTSFWTPFDLIILPPTSSVVSFARNVRLLSVAHPLMVWEPRCLRAIAEALEA